MKAEADFCFCGEGDDTDSWDLGDDSFLGWEEAGDECLPLVLEESALLRQRAGFMETFTGTGEEGDGLEREDSWLAKAGLPLRTVFSGSAVPLEPGELLVVFSGFFVNESEWPGGFTSLTGELSTESLWST